MKIVQLQYIPKTKREHALLIVLDDSGRIWFANNPFYATEFVWHELALPDELEWAEPVD